jgi:signal transduction histidine kinase
VLHELNNPLHAMGLLVDELAQSDGDAEHRRDLLKRVRAQLDRARSHLQTLRDMRTGGEPEVEGVTLDHVIESVAAEASTAAAKEGLVVEAPMGPPVRANADPTYVRVILENLLDNSLASLREVGAGRVRIQLSEEAGRAVVRVCDDGPPIDARIDATLFEPLRSSKTHGLGLGLPIARALARAMRGDGKTFRLALPLREGSS